MPFCPQCGNEVNTNDQFCSCCRNHLTDVPTEQVVEEYVTQQRKPKRSNVHFLLIFALLILVGIGAFIFLNARKSTGFSDNPAEIEKASTSVVLLECYNKSGELYCTGSAFAAIEDGVFVTNYHVVEQEAYHIIAKTEDGTMFEIDSILAFDAARDIAILKTKSDTHISPLPVSSSDNLAKGEKVVAIGSPLGLLNTVSTGVFSGYNNNGIINEIQFTASISHGSSGGALFNNKGEVIGITYGSYTDGQNLNLAIPFRYVEEMMRSATQKMSIPEFYDTFEHYVDVYVEDVLKHKATIDIPFANLIGVVADKNSQTCSLVSDGQHLQKYLEFLSPPSEERKKPSNENNNSGFNDDAFWEALGQSKWSNEFSDFKAEYTILLQDSSKGANVFRSLEVGDIICVKTSLKPRKVTSSPFLILVNNAEDIVILSK